MHCEVTVHLDVRGQPLETRRVSIGSASSFRQLVDQLEAAFDMPLRVVALRRESDDDTESATDSRSMGGLLESWETVGSGGCLSARFFFSFFSSFLFSLLLLKPKPFLQIQGTSLSGVEIWVQRPDASGARTPPQLADNDNPSLKDSLGSLAHNRQHEFTPPDSEDDDD